MKSLPLALAAAVLLSACSGSSDEPPADRPTSAPTSSPTTEATAMSTDGDVEVWDLTGEPSNAAFGIPTDPPSADYSDGDPRTVRFELDGGSFELALDDLTFYHPEGDIYAFLSRSAELEPDQLASTYRSLIEQLGVDDTTADQLESGLAKSSTDEPGQVSVSYPDEIRLGDWTIALSAAIAPAVGTGIVTVSAGYKPLPIG